MPAVIQDEDAVDPLHGREPVGDDDRRAAAHRGLERRLHGALAFGVERRGRFVEQQQRRILEDRARDGEPLALAAGQAQPALADLGSVALRQAQDELLDVRGARRGQRFVLAGVRAAVEDVVEHRAGEDHRLLRHDRDAPAQVVEAQPARTSTPSMPDRAVVDVVEALQQLEHGALAGARRADQRHRLARFDREREFVEHALLRPRRIGEADAIELDPRPARRGRQRHRLRAAN